MLTNLGCSVSIAIVFSGVYLWMGMLTGVWKYYQIFHSEQARAHYYVDIAHRSSLLYASATLILAVLAYFSIWQEWVNVLLILANIVFFSFSILSYVAHGFMRDTQNQFQTPHTFGKGHLPQFLMTSAMILLIVAEVGATSILLIGAIMGLS